MALSALARARAIYESRGERARELKAEGRKVLGYMCNFAPIEMVEAVGLVPYRIRGDTQERVTEADQFVEASGCPFVRNTFDQALKGRYDFLDGLVMSHACDSVQRMYGIWTQHKPAAFNYLFNVPHTVTQGTERFFMRELQIFREALEKFSGRKMDDATLAAAIDLYNRNRKLIGELYALRRTDPPLITGAEMLEVLIAGTGVPGAEFETLLTEVKAEVLGRSRKPEKKAARLMFYGCINDDTTLVRLIEECSASLVMDDTCIGARSMLGNVGGGEQMLEGLMHYYFRNFQCPRTYRGTDMKRFDYLIESAREANAQGVVLYILSFCDPHKADVVEVRSYLEEAGLPSLVLEDDYSMGNLESMRTRIEAFIETIA